MHAKLVVGATSVSIYQIIRDICRLLTSEAPSIADLSGQGFSTTSSAILDTSPAGWTYVGSNKATDQPAIGDGSADATYNSTTAQLWACSAPMLNSSRLKYVVFSQNITGATTYPYAGAMFGAQSVSPLGVVTGPSAHYFATAGTTNLNANACPTGLAGVTLHLVATPRGVVIVREGAGFCAVLETTSTDAHEFYNNAAFISIWNPNGGTGAISSTGPLSNVSGFWVNTFGVTDPNTGTYYAAYDCTGGGNLNQFNLFQNGTQRAMSQDVTGMSQYLVSPMYVHNHMIGYPVQFVSGVFPIFWCKSAIGSTGDTLMVGDDEYKFFNCGSNTAGYGLLMQTQ